VQACPATSRAPARSGRGLFSACPAGPTTTRSGPLEPLGRAERCVASGLGGLLQLDKEDVRRCVADVLTAVHLGIEPPSLALCQGDVARLGSAADQAPLETAQGVHDAVRVLVRARPLAWLVAILEDSHPVILKDGLVLMVIVYLTQKTGRGGSSFGGRIARPPWLIRRLGRLFAGRGRA
jgi:hypothetical protein